MSNAFDMYRGETMAVIADAPALALIDCARCDDGPFTEDEMAGNICRACTDRINNPCECCGSWICPHAEARGR